MIHKNKENSAVVDGNSYVSCFYSSKLEYKCFYITSREWLKHFIRVTQSIYSFAEHVCDDN